MCFDLSETDGARGEAETSFVANFQGGAEEFAKGGTEESGAKADPFDPGTGISFDRVGDDSAFFGTELLFRRAGFRVVRNPLPGLPRNWTPRVAMRCDASTVHVTKTDAT